jgi:maltose alpha-D-glucosyltransferase/alpha-amylase
LRSVTGTEKPDGALLSLARAAADVASTWLCDASQATELAQALHQLAFNEQRLLGKALEVRGYRYAPTVLPPPQPVKPLGAEQSNTSFVFGHDLVGKLVRRAEPGGSLEVEILESLRRQERAPNVPVLEARVDVALPGGVGTLWMSERFIANEGDAWHLAIDHAQRFYERALTEAWGKRQPPLGSAPEDVPSEVLLDFVPLSRLLGRRTAELHTALYESTQGGPSAPKPFNALSSRAFYQSLRNLSARTFDALKSAAVPESAQALARAVLERKAQLRKILDHALAEPLTGPRMRIHGDYHLGQVLYTGSDFFIIDFEGEPARAPAERRRLRSPLADVAGMLRSLHYAAFGVLHMPLPGAQIRPEDRAQLEPWARYFHQACGRAFTTGYLTNAQGAPFTSLASDPFDGTLLLHLVEKNLYEVLYELDNRPTWVELPLRGLLALLDG